MSTVLARIKENLPRLHPSFRNIGSHILDHHNNVAFSPILTMARELDVSTATLVRFAKQLGYSGYQEFRKALQEELRHQLQPRDKVNLTGLGGLPEKQRIQKLIQNEHNNLRDTLQGLDPADLESIVETLKTCRSIYVAGFGITRHLAQVLHTSLLADQGKDAFLISGSISDYYPQLKNFTADDVMFILTFPPYSAETRQVAEVVKERKGTLYLFTDSAACPIYPDARRIIKCATNSMLTANSFVGVISSIHILVHMLLLSQEGCGESVREGMEIEQKGYALIAGSRDTPPKKEESPCS